LTKCLPLGYDGGRGAPWDDPQEVVPAPDDTPSVPLDQLLQSNGHLLLNSYWVIDLSRDVEQLKQQKQIISINHLVISLKFDEGFYV
jgi:hypothetical protein